MFYLQHLPSDAGVHVLILFILEKNYVNRDTGEYGLKTQHTAQMEQLAEILENTQIDPF